MKNANEEIKKVNGAQELDDDMLDGVSGGLVQLINPSSNRGHECQDCDVVFKNGKCCPGCGSRVMYCYGGSGQYIFVRCNYCGYDIGRRIDITSIIWNPSAEYYNK